MMIFLADNCGNVFARSKSCVDLDHFIAGRKIQMGSIGSNFEVFNKCYQCFQVFELFNDYIYDFSTLLSEYGSNCA